MGNDLCCETAKEPGKTPGVANIISHKDRISLEDTEQRSNAQIEEIMRHTTVNLDKRYRYEDFEKKALLGAGGFGTVYLVELVENKKKGITKYYAMKQISKKKLFERRVVENVTVEKKVLAELKSPFIIELNFAFQDKHNCYFVMEYAAGGQVYSLIDSSRPENQAKVTAFRALGEEGPRFILACVVLAIECLHKHNIMYRDLKPENVLIFESGYPKLADFGLAKKNEPEELSKTLAGTKIYFAPEIIQRKGHSRYVDFWTLGVFLHELILMVPPFDPSLIARNKFMKYVQGAEKEWEWKKDAVISTEAKNIIRAFLRADPTKRLGVNGFDDIKSHAFFNGFDWNALQSQRMISPLYGILKQFPSKTKELTAEDIAPPAESAAYDGIPGFTYKEAPPGMRD